MANNYYSNQTFSNPITQSQQFFPQPQGNIYIINNSLEVANVPMSGGISVALCMSEGLMYLKTMQNGNPMFMAYKITPYENENKNAKNDNLQETNIDKESVAYCMWHETEEMLQDWYEEIKHKIDKY